MAPRVRLRSAGLAALALASVLLLSACNAPSGAAENFPGRPVAEDAAVQDEAGEPDQVADGEEADEAEEEVVDPMEPNDEPEVIWWADGQQLALIISGSSSCPVVGNEIRVVDEAGEGNRVAIELVQRPEDEICTMDFVPHTTLFWTPSKVTTTEPLEVEVYGTTVRVPIK